MIQAYWTLLLLSGAGVAGAANEQVIDAFSYADAKAARAVWTAGKGTQPVEVARDGTRTVLQLRAPFASDHELPRSIIERFVNLDLASVGEFHLDVCVLPAETSARVTFYFRSGGGWYGANDTVEPNGWKTLRFSKAAFRSEGKPAGWHKIDGIRISVWRDQAVDMTVRLARVASVWHDVALVLPATSSVKNAKDLDSVKAVSQQFGEMLSELGLGSDAIENAALSRGALGKRRVAVLAYNPSLNSEAVDALERFVEKGGKLFVCYSIPGRLANLLGIRRLRYYRPEQSGVLAEVRFDDTDIAGLPRVVRQASWNIHSPEVQGGEARVIGTWYDTNGKPTGYPAMTLSDRGAYFSHIVLSDDRDHKKEMVGAILGHLAPSFWPTMAQHAISRIGDVGHLNGVAAVVQHVRSASGQGRGVASFQAGVQAEQGARACFARKAYPDAIRFAHDSHTHFVDAYLRTTPSRNVEARGFWNHSGTGAYPGDWDRTARELAAAGINMILPNMLWAGCAHFPSNVLPRSSTYEQYGDQIAQCIAASHKYGLEVHVWKVNHNLSRAPNDFVAQLKREGRLQMSRSGQIQNWLCPSHERNLRLEVDSMLEVAKRYAVDGLHFDYIRYPNQEHCYCPGCRERFEAQTGIKVRRWPDDCYSGPLQERYRDWRCDQITRLVRLVSQEAKRIKPGIKISAAVFGSYPKCRDSVAQDWVAWVRAGYLDFVCPMDYSQSDLLFQDLVQNQMELVQRRVPVYPGVGAWRLTADRTVGQIQLARSLGATGFILFDLNAETIRSHAPALALGVGKQRAALPHRADGK